MSYNGLVNEEEAVFIIQFGLFYLLFFCKFLEWQNDGGMCEE